MPHAIRPFEPADAPGAHALLAAHGWQHRIPSVEGLLALTAASQRTLVAVGSAAAGQPAIVGFARALTDGLSNGYLSMVVVHADCRGQGIGTALVQGIVGDDPAITWVLRAGRGGAPEFFARQGFVASTQAMERVRRQPA